ncbi:hypothetical protein JCM10212_001889 [Sporobolomyces blumeae]
MADYWISRDKYFCKYCKIYIADDKPSRIHHETGLRHKGNYERYIRDIYKRGAKDAKDKREEEKEIKRIEAAARAAMGIEDKAGTEGPVASTSTSKGKEPAPAAAAAAAKPADPFANYTTAASLGIVDHEAERKKAEDEERELRHKEGTIGQWQKVVKPRARADPVPPPRLNLPTGALLPAGTIVSFKNKDGDVKPQVKAEDEQAPDEAREDEAEPGRDGRHDDEAAAKPKRRGYFTEKRFDADDDEFDPTQIGGGQLNLKRKRLTLKEEKEIEERAEAERKRREEEEAERRREAKRRGRGEKGGWQEVAIEAEPLLEFDDLPVADASGSGEAGTEGGGAGRADDEGEDRKVPTEVADESKPEPAKSGFKKRKMHGAGTIRKK